MKNSNNVDDLLNELSKMQKQLLNLNENIVKEEKEIEALEKEVEITKNTNINDDFFAIYLSNIGGETKKTQTTKTTLEKENRLEDNIQKHTPKKDTLKTTLKEKPSAPQVDKSYDDNSSTKQEFLDFFDATFQKKIDSDVDNDALKEKLFNEFLNFKKNSKLSKENKDTETNKNTNAATTSDKNKETSRKEASRLFEESVTQNKEQKTTQNKEQKIIEDAKKEHEKYTHSLEEKSDSTESIENNNESSTEKIEDNGITNKKDTKPREGESYLSIKDKLEKIKRDIAAHELLMKETETKKKKLQTKTTGKVVRPNFNYQNTASFSEKKETAYDENNPLSPTKKSKKS